MGWINAQRLFKQFCGLGRSALCGNDRTKICHNTRVPRLKSRSAAERRFSFR